MIVSFLRTVVAEFVGLFYVLSVQSVIKNTEIDNTSRITTLNMVPRLLLLHFIG